MRPKRIYLMNYLIPIAIGIQRRKNGKEEELMVYFILSSLLSINIAARCVMNSGFLLLNSS
jgi:hypothetical protein